MGRKKIGPQLRNILKHWSSTITIVWSNKIVNLFIKNGEYLSHNNVRVC